MNISELSPFFRVGRSNSIDIGPFKWGIRTLLDYEIIYMKEGSLILNYDGMDYPLNEGNIVMIRPGVPNGLRCETNTIINQVHMHFDVIYNQYSKVYNSNNIHPNEMTETERLMIREDVFAGTELGAPFFKISDKAAFLALFNEILRVYEERPYLYELICKTKLLELITMIIRDNITVVEKSEIPSMQIVNAVKSYLDQHCTENITLQELEEKFNYSRFHLEKLYYEQFNISIIRYHNLARLRHAEKMLLESNPPSINDIADALSFKSASAFSRFFKKHIGMSPSQYIQKSK